MKYFSLSICCAVFSLDQILYNVGLSSVDQVTDQIERLFLRILRLQTACQCVANANVSLGTAAKPSPWKASWDALLPSAQQAAARASWFTVVSPGGYPREDVFSSHVGRISPRPKLKRS